MTRHFFSLEKSDYTALTHLEVAGSPLSDLPEGTQTHFMQVAILSKGECFGVGKYVLQAASLPNERRLVGRGEALKLRTPAHIAH